MLEKLLILCADPEFTAELNTAVNNLEERVGSNPDINELKSVIENTMKLCQEI
mgnify:CR=1 FL=1